jgi:N-acetylneuraminic acid mutarotase
MIPAVLTNRDEAISFGIGNAGFVGVPDPRYNENKLNFYRYDTATDSWSQVASLPSKYWASELVVFAVAGKGYVVNTEQDSSRDVWEYDPQADTWTRKNPFPGAQRYRAISFVLGNTGYLGGGASQRSATMRELWAYNPQDDSWTQKANVEQDGQSLVAFTHRGKAYVGFGNWNGKIVKQYNPLTNSWTRQADYMGLAYGLVTAMSIGDRGYFFGGVADNMFCTDTWEFTAP